MSPSLGWNRLVALTALALLAGCGRPRISFVPQVPRRATVAAPIEGMFLVWLGNNSSRRGSAALGDSSRGPRHWVSTGLRYERQGDRAVFEAPPIDGLEAVLPFAGGWRFVTDDTVLDSDSFVGPLRQHDLLSVGRPGRGTGRVVRVHHGTLEGAPPPAIDGTVLDAAFVDERRGVLVVEPGRGMSTEDGGGRWTALNGGPFSGAFAAQGRRWFETRRGCFELQDGGALVDVPCETMPAFRPLDLRETEPPATPAGAPQLVPFPILRAASGGPGRLWLEGPDRVSEIELSTGNVVAPRFQLPPCASASRGTRYLLGEHLDVICGDTAEGPATLLRHHPDGSWRELIRYYRTSVRMGPSCSVREDGRAVVCAGGCAPVAVDISEADRRFCVRQDGGRPEEMRLGRPEEEGQYAIAGWHGGEPVFVRLHRNPSRAEWVRGAGDPSPLVGMAPVLGPGIEPSASDDLAIGADGRLRMSLNHVTPRPHDSPTVHAAGVIEGRPGGTFATRPLPPWWDELASAPDDRQIKPCGPDGVVVAASPRHGYWVSEGTNRPWRPLFEDGDGELRRWLAVNPPPFNRFFTCDAWGVRFLDYGRTIGWGTLREPVLGTANLPTGSERERRPAPYRLSWRCQTTERATVAEPSPGITAPEEPTVRLAGLDRSSRLVASRARDTGGAVVMSSFGVTLSDPYPAYHPIDRVDLSDARDQSSYVGLVHDGADGLSFVTVVGREREVAVALFDATTAGRVQVRRRWTFDGGLPDVSHVGSGCNIGSGCSSGVSLGMVGTVTAASFGSRSTAVLRLPTWNQGRTRRVLAMEHAVGGEVRTAELELADAEDFGAFALPDASGVARLDGSGVLWGVTLDGSRRRLAPALRWETCPADARGMVVLPVYVAHSQGWDDLGHQPGVRAEFGFHDGGLCLRRMSAFGFVMEARAGRWEAVAIDASGRGWVRATCEPSN